MTDRQLDEVLEELGREHRAIDAPDSMGRVLCAAAESRKAALGKPRLQFPWAWARAAMALVVVAVSGVFWRSLQTHQSQTEQSQKERAQTERAHSLAAPQVSPEPSHASPVPAAPSIEPRVEPVRATVKARTPLQPASPPDGPTSSSLDAFVPLSASEGLPSAAALSIVRIRLRGSDLQQYGLQTPADAMAQTMLAEFAVGEDGLPRAIRIVR